MTKYLTIISGLLFSLNTLAQTGSVKGTVKSKEGAAIEFANVYIKGSSIGVTTDKNGNFQLEKITIGSHTLVASSVGLKTIEKLIEVKENETIDVDFTLDENFQELQSVEIFGRKETDYKSDYSFSGNKNGNEIS
jgi:iron complex outermembrane recepter protein